MRASRSQGHARPSKVTKFVACAHAPLYWPLLALLAPRTRWPTAAGLAPALLDPFVRTTNRRGCASGTMLRPLLADTTTSLSKYEAEEVHKSAKALQRLKRYAMRTERRGRRRSDGPTRYVQPRGVSKKRSSVRPKNSGNVTIGPTVVGPRRVL